MNARVLSHAEWGIWCLIFRRRWKIGFSVGISRFQIRRDLSRKTLSLEQENSVFKVKMSTGDHVAIAKETCRVIGVGTKIPTTKDIPANEADTFRDRFGELVEGCDGFAGVHPEHKFQTVQVLKSRGWLTGMTGDGVNDAPALKKANVGIAVDGATVAAQGAAAGLSAIVEAIDLSRKIFQRMKNFVIYSITYTL